MEEYHQLFQMQEGILDEVETKLADTAHQLTDVTQQLTTVTQQMTAQAQEIERLRQRIQHQEERLQRVRQDVEPTIEISSGHVEPQGSDHSVNQSDAAHVAQPGQHAAEGTGGHSDPEPMGG
ncbi:hypothetical protein [Candidatus Burkholderia verschuerenii]|uniref:hypothetical protein n=1 Tax=Candidatus Burkholderia verschuerenii TaxID=242163 RepID=UPI0012EE381A|nr:hypothetical protein [Candidatus Burkholderia verschuerenii]